jgi:hypothetical protein
VLEARVLIYQVPQIRWQGYASFSADPPPIGSFGVHGLFPLPVIVANGATFFHAKNIIFCY